MCPCVPDQIGISKCWFLRRGKNCSIRKNLPEQGENQQTNSTHINILWHQHQDLNQGHIRGKCFHHYAIQLLPHVLHKGASSPFFTVAIDKKHIQDDFLRTSEVQVQFIYYYTLNKILHKAKIICLLSATSQDEQWLHS